MATFGELWSAIAPAGSPYLVPGPADLEREVAWVRVLRARVPAFDAFDPGDVAIVPASALAFVAPRQPEIGILVDALVAGKSAGLLLIAGEGADGADDAIAALGAAAATAGIPAVRVGPVDPQALERAAIGFLVNQRAEVQHQAALIEAGLEEIALGGGDIATLVAGVGGLLGRAVALEGRRGETIAIHAPEEASGAGAAATAYLGGARRAALRVVLPVTPAPAGPAGSVAAAGSGPPGSGPAAPSAAATGTPRGSVPPGLVQSDRRAARPDAREGRLLLLGDRPASDLERVVAPRIARLLALELGRTEAVRRAQDKSRRGDVLPADGPPWVVLIARQAFSGTVPPLEARDEIRARVRVLGPPRRLALRGDADSLELRLVLAADATDPGGAGLAGRVADLLGRVVAVSRPFADRLGRPLAEAEARSTLEAAEALPDRPRVALAARLPAYRLLLALGSLPDGRRQAEVLLERLLVGTVEARRERLVTLRAVLEESGMAEAAASLGIHRNTLAYRIRRIETLTGWRLADPDLRLPLLIAVRFVQSEQDRPESS